MASIEDMILLPGPHSVVAKSGVYRLTSGRKIVCQGDNTSTFPIASRLQRALWESQRVSWTLRAGSAGTHASIGGARIKVSSDQAIPAQGYRLRVSGDGIDLVAGDDAGAFYGVATLVQMLRQCGLFHLLTQAPDGQLPDGVTV